ncbi:hypothetical protein CHS0354_006832 [Potamilus streckersoni]|uniref:ABC transporter domain-containing protein n=1 Tax=Potamilus streckersoni TaxID=2493646 RepID=A0AAE0WBS0_9BIVA|nr:hypothetical protein CHS0354_006832 [Potamilus streckersoni]
MKKLITLLAVGIFAAGQMYAATKVAIVFDAGGKFDKSFNQSAWEGVQKAQKDFGIELKDVEPGDLTKVEEAMRTFAKEKYDLIIGIGFASAPAVEAVAKEYKDVNFAIVDSEVKLPNVVSLSFKEEEGSFLVGAIAAMRAKDVNGKKVVGFIGGMDIPLIHKFEQGYMQGAKAVNPKIEVLVNYVGNTPTAWNDPAKAKEITNAQISKGASVIYAAAGGSGNGLFDTVKELSGGKACAPDNAKCVYAIGVDSNQNYIVPGVVLTSMVKKVNVAVYNTVKAVQNKKFAGKANSFGLKEGGVDYALDDNNKSLIDAKTKAAVDKYKKDIIAGKIKGVLDLVVDTTVPAVRFTAVNKQFGSFYANRDITFDVQRQSVHAVIGENGAGKSTIMKILFGFYRADSGQVEVFGRSVRPKDPTDAITLGIGMVHQHFMLIPNMTVAENIVLGFETVSKTGMLELKKTAELIRSFSEKYNMPIDPYESVENLSVGQKQRVEIIKALYRGAEILILDEPTAVLTPNEVSDFFEVLKRLKAEGKTIILITHKLNEVMAVSDRITVMRTGKIVGETDTKDTSSEALARMMVGRDVLLEIPEKSEPHERRVLEISGLSASMLTDYALKNISLHIREGEILGIAGVSGNGQTTLEEVINGSITPTAGRITLNGEDISTLSVRERKEHKIVHVPSDREKHDLSGGFPIVKIYTWGIILWISFPIQTDFCAKKILKILPKPR